MVSSRKLQPMFLKVHGISIPTKEIIGILKTVFELISGQLAQNESKFCDMLDSISIMKMKQNFIKFACNFQNKHLFAT